MERGSPLLIPADRTLYYQHGGESAVQEATDLIVKLGIFMVALVRLRRSVIFYIAYYGHIMGARIERGYEEWRFFGHYQKLSFAFYDNQKVGHLLSRITSDLFDISELLHHGPEDLVISIIKFIGAFIILMFINTKLALSAFLFVPFLLVYAFIYNRKMKSAFRENRARIADINTQIEDSLSGIRVVKSFANEKEEMKNSREAMSALWIPRSAAISTWVPTIPVWAHLQP